jgi:hypothetical protein
MQLQQRYIQEGSMGGFGIIVVVLIPRSPSVR